MTETDPETKVVLEKEVWRLRMDLNRLTDTVAELINIVTRQSKLLEKQAAFELEQLEKPPSS